MESVLSCYTHAARHTFWCAQSFNRKQIQVRSYKQAVESPKWVKAQALAGSEKDSLTTTKVPNYGYARDQSTSTETAEG